MKKFLKDFYKFISKGNVVELAVGVIIASCFSSVTKSFVDDILMPLVSLVFKKNIADLKLTLKEAVYSADGTLISKAITLNYGNFIQSIFNFIIIALIVFIIVKALNKVKKNLKKLEFKKVLKVYTIKDRQIKFIKNIFKNKTITYKIINNKKE